MLGILFQLMIKQNSGHHVGTENELEQNDPEDLLKRTVALPHGVNDRRGGQQTRQKQSHTVQQKHADGERNGKYGNGTQHTHHEDGYVCGDLYEFDYDGGFRQGQSVPFFADASEEAEDAERCGD